MYIAFNVAQTVGSKDLTLDFQYLHIFASYIHSCECFFVVLLHIMHNTTFTHTFLKIVLFSSLSRTIFINYGWARF